MKPIRKTSDKDYRWLETSTGEKWYGLNWSSDARVDVESNQYVSITEKEEYAKCSWPTLNDLKAAGFIKEVSICKELDITAAQVADITDLDAVIAYAKEHGFNIEREALEHNYEAWRKNCKSAYRGKECHVFTPIGENPLRFSISSLHEYCKEWQQTYVS